MTAPPEPLGLIAGNGHLPLAIAREARRRGLSVVTVAHRGETLPEIALEVDEITWVSVGSLGRIVQAFRAAGVRRAIMAGGLDKARLLRRFRPDLAALRVLLSVRGRGDDRLLRAVADYLATEGIEIVDCAALTPDLLAPAGVLSRRPPTAPERTDIEEGWRVARALGDLDVGQSVAVKSGAIVAVEAVEGTDALIRRAGELAGPGVVIVKAAKPGQDLRFDVPTVGPQTVETMAEVGAAVLAVEAGRTLLLDRAETVARANRHRIALVGHGT
jgi:DUF1009 family protein